ncbi:hypothetical protein ACIRD3_01410 [Kitasatospora sp. NPDC093550]|uniref:hypothetical protein n=1 Tax=Kitasatospora sp. NPDC093550 TaxID=3364089 RepID=UPI003810CEF7
MTVLHSRNADAADPADVADAADVKDPQDAAAEPDLREDLGRYADLGAFTLTADTHAWYAAVDTVATPEDARAASTALAELRGRDLQQTWEAVTALAAEVKLDEPDTVAKTALLVEMLQRVHRTSATLTPAAYDADLGALAAATADSAWRRENGVKLSWLRGRSLRKQATALATDRRVRREDLHEALASAEIERRAWAALAPAGTLPVAPSDGALVDRTAQAFEAITTGLRDLARLLPDHDLDGLAFGELIDLVERLAADEGTLYRLPTIRGLRATLEEAGLGELLAELTAAKADRRAAEAAYAARQALAGGQRDGLAESAVVEETAVEASDVPASEVSETDASETDASGADVSESETEVSDVEASDAEAAARQALAGGQRDGLVEEAPVSVTAPLEEVEAVEAVAAIEVAVEEAVAPEVDVEAEVETEAEVEVEVEVEPAPEADTDTVTDAVTAEVEPAVLEELAEEETPADVVSLPAPSPAADDLVAAATAALAEAAAADEAVAEEASPVVEAEEPTAEAEASEEPVAEVVEPVAEVEVEVEVVEPADEAVVAETPAVEESADVEPVAEPVAEELVAEPVVEEPVAEVVAEEPAVEPVAGAAVEEPSVEVVDGVEPVAEAVVEEPAVEAEVDAAAAEESAVEPEAVVDQPAAELEPEVEPAAEPEPEAAEEVAAEPVAADDASGRPAKPDFTPGRPVTAYSADELLAVVRWVDGDGVERSEEELLRAAMKELGFARLGPRIKEALGAAVTAARG